MPTVLRVLNLIYMIHTKDHGHPHVTIYLGTPEKFEAMAKIRLDVVKEIEVKGFNGKAVARLIEVVKEHQNEWLEVWNETREG